MCEYYLYCWNYTHDDGPIYGQWHADVILVKPTFSLHKFGYVYLPNGIKWSDQYV